MSWAGGATSWHMQRLMGHVVTHERPIETPQKGEERGKAKEDDGATPPTRLKRHWSYPNVQIFMHTTSSNRPLRIKCLEAFLLILPFYIMYILGAGKTPFVIPFSLFCLGKKKKRRKTEEISSKLEKIQIHFLWMASGAHSRRRMDESEKRWLDQVEKSSYLYFLILS